MLDTFFNAFIQIMCLPSFYMSRSPIGYSHIHYTIPTDYEQHLCAVVDRPSDQKKGCQFNQFFYAVVPSPELAPLSAVSVLPADVPPPAIISM